MWRGWCFFGLICNVCTGAIDKSFALICNVCTGAIDKSFALICNVCTGAIDKSFALICNVCTGAIDKSFALICNVCTLICNVCTGAIDKSFALICNVCTGAIDKSFALICPRWSGHPAPSPSNIGGESGTSEVMTLHIRVTRFLFCWIPFRSACSTTPRVSSVFPHLHVSTFACRVWVNGAWCPAAYRTLLRPHSPLHPQLFFFFFFFSVPDLPSDVSLDGFDQSSCQKQVLFVAAEFFC